MHRRTKRVNWALAVCMMILLSVFLPAAASASSAFDEIIITSDTLTLGGVDRGATWHSDLETYSTNHPQDIALTDALTELNAAIATGSGWAVFICPSVACGGGGYGQVIVTPPNAHYGFHVDPWSGPFFGVSKTDATLLYFAYADQGEMQIAGANGAAAVGTYSDNNFQEWYFGYTTYSNTSVTARVLYVTNQVDYPSGYTGELVPSTYTPPTPTYVAMGDSFSSGEGNPPFEMGTYSSGVNECHRSTQAYPRLLASDSSLELGPTAFVACAGATTQNVLYGGSGEGAWGEAPQVDALSADTQVVTITIGGNDVGFKNFTSWCLLGSCAQGTPAYNTMMNNITNPSFQVKLKSTYSEILSRVSSTTNVYVVGYPYVTPEDPSDPYCQIFQDQAEDPFAGTESTAARKVVDELNETIESAIDQVEDARLHFVDPTTGGSSNPFDGHDVCATVPYFVYPFAQTESHNWFHPNTAGHQAYADVVKEAMTS